MHHGQLCHDPLPRVTYSVAGIRRGVVDALPVCLSVVPWAVAFGLAAQPVFDRWQMLAMSGYVFSGTAQFVALERWSTSGIVPLLLAVFAVNSRYLIQGLTLAPWLSQVSRGRRWMTLFFLSDGPWVLSLKRFEAGDLDAGHLLGGGVASYLTWVVGSIVGFAIPLASFDVARWGLDFAAAAVLIAFAGGRWQGRADLLPWAVAAAVAITVESFVGDHWFALAGGVAGAVVAAIRDARTGSDDRDEDSPAHGRVA